MGLAELALIHEEQKIFTLHWDFNCGGLHCYKLNPCFNKKKKYIECWVGRAPIKIQFQPCKYVNFCHRINNSSPPPESPYFHSSPKRQVVCLFVVVFFFPLLSLRLADALIKMCTMNLEAICSYEKLREHKASGCEQSSSLEDATAILRRAQHQPPHWLCYLCWPLFQKYFSSKELYLLHSNQCKSVNSNLKSINL